MNKKKSILNKNIDIDTETNNNTQIKSISGYNCIGPCYPPNTIYYNPMTLTFIKSDFPSCPIKKKEILLDNGNKTTIYADKCYTVDINKGYIYFDIFDDSVKIANSANLFLVQIYNINNISDVIFFLNNSIDILPLYSQRRILKAIFEVYYKYIEFPKIFFSKKISTILKKIYKIKNNFNDDEMISDLNIISSKSIDIYKFFLEKYS